MEEGSAIDGEAMLGLMRQHMARARELDDNNDDGPTPAATTATKLENNDPSLTSLVISPTPPDTLTYVIQNRPVPERYLPESEEEWRRIGDLIGAHGHIEDLEFYRLESRHDMMALLAGAVHNRSIQTLKFNDSWVGGWAFDALAPFLASNANLRKVEVNHCCLHDPFLAIVPSLGTSALEEFTSMGNRTGPIDLDGLEEVGRRLCDTTSIDATYRSNHRLCRLSVYNESSDGMSEELVDLPADLRDSLRLNGNENKADVAREKILRCHFSGERFSLDPFEEGHMDVRVLPSLLSWIGRPGLGPAPDVRVLSLMTGRITIARGRENECSQSIMFNFLRRMPMRVFASSCSINPCGKRNRNAGIAK